MFCCCLSKTNRKTTRCWVRLGKCKRRAQKRARQNKTKTEEKKWQEKRSDYLVIYYTYIIVRLSKPVPQQVYVCVCSSVIFRCNCTLWLPLLESRRTEEETTEKKIIYIFKCIPSCLDLNIFFTRSRYLFVYSDFLVLFFCVFAHSFFISYVATWFTLSLSLFP